MNFLEIGWPANTNGDDGPREEARVRAYFDLRPPTLWFPALVDDEASDYTDGAA